MIRIVADAGCQVRLRVHVDREDPLVALRQSAGEIDNCGGFASTSLPGDRGNGYGHGVILF